MHTISKGTLISTKDEFKLSQEFCTLSSIVMNTNYGSSKAYFPESVFTEQPGQVFYGFRQSDEQQKFLPLGNFQHLVNFQLKQKHKQLLGYYEQQKSELNNISLDVFHRKKRQQQRDEEAALVKQALNAAAAALGEILQQASEKMESNVSSQHILDLMRQSGPLSTRDITTLLYNKQHIQLLTESLPLHFQADKPYHVFPQDTLFQRFSTLYLLKSFVESQKFVILPLPDGNLKVLARFLACFYRERRSSQRRFTALIELPEAQEFIQSDEFRQFFNQVPVQIYYVDENCEVQRNPGKAQKQLETFHFGVEKMDFFMPELHKQEIESNIIMDSGVQIVLILVDFEALLAPQVQQELYGLQQQLKIQEFDFSAAYHYEQFVRRKGSFPLLKVQQKMKIAAIAELTPQCPADIVEWVLSDEIRPVENTNEINEKCNKFLRPATYRASEEIIQKSLAQVHFVTCSLQLQRQFKKNFDAAQNGILAENILTVLSQEESQNVFSIYDDDVEYDEKLIKYEINDIIKDEENSTKIENQAIANCLKQDLKILCCKQLAKFAENSQLRELRSDKHDCLVDYHYYRNEKFQVESNTSSIVRAYLTLRKSPCPVDKNNIKLGGITIPLKEMQRIHYRVLPKPQILTLPPQLMLIFCNSSLPEYEEEQQLRSNRARYASLRSFCNFCCMVDDFIERLQFRHSNDYFNEWNTISPFDRSIKQVAPPNNEFSYSPSFYVRKIKQQPFLTDLRLELLDLAQQAHALFFCSARPEIAVKADIIDPARATQGKLAQITSHQQYTFWLSHSSFVTLTPQMLFPAVRYAFQLPKHPIFHQIDDILDPYVRKYFYTEHLLLQFQKSKNNMQRHRLIENIAFLAVKADLPFLQNYINIEYSFLAKQFRFFFISDYLDIITCQPVCIVVLPQAGQDLIVQQLKEMVFKSDVRAFVLQFQNAKFQEQIVDFESSQPVISACKLLTNEVYLEKRILAHLQEKQAENAKIDEILDNLLGRTAKKKFALLKAAACNYEELLCDSGNSGRREWSYEQFNAQLFNYAMYHIPQIGDAAYLKLPNQELYNCSQYIQIYKKMTCNYKDFLLSRPRRRTYSLRGLLQRSGERVEPQIQESNYYAIYNSLISALINMFITQPFKSQQLDAQFSTNVYSSAFIAREPERRFFIPRCCQMQDINQFIFELVQSNNKAVYHSFETRFSVQDNSYSDQIIHYMDSLHLYAFAHCDLKAVSLTMQYIRQQFAANYEQQQHINTITTKIIQNVNSMLTEQGRGQYEEQLYNISFELQNRLLRQFEAIFYFTKQELIERSAMLSTLQKKYSLNIKQKEFEQFLNIMRTGGDFDDIFTKYTAYKSQKSQQELFQLKTPFALQSAVNIVLFRYNNGGIRTKQMTQLFKRQSALIVRNAAEGAQASLLSKEVVSNYNGKMCHWVVKATRVAGRAPGAQPADGII